MGQKFLHAAEVEVDSQNRIIPTPATVAPRTTVVTVTAAGLTLNALIAAARAAEAADQKVVLATTRKVTLIIAAAAVITWTTGGAAPDANSTPLPVPGLEMIGTATSLAGLRFFAANVTMSIVEEG